VETYDITLRSADPVDLGDLGADGFEELLRATLDCDFTWKQDAEGRIGVNFRHEATDAGRAYGAAEAVAGNLGTAVWTVSVAQDARH